MLSTPCRIGTRSIGSFKSDIIAVSTAFGKGGRMAHRRPDRIAGAEQSGDERPTNEPGAPVTNMRCGVMSPCYDAQLTEDYFE
jgi:hypothetical protein